MAGPAGDRRWTGRTSLHRFSSVAPDLDAAVGRIADIDPAPVVHGDADRERELPVLDAVAAEEAEVLGLALALDERPVDEDAVAARVHDEEAALAVRGETARQAEVPGSRTA